MAGGASGYHDEEPGAGMISDINVTPLVDITLVLLIIFMVTARLIAQRGISVESPKTVSGETIETPLDVTIRPGGELFLNGERVADLDVIAGYVRTAVATNPELKPIITADKSVAHGEVMEVIDAIKVAGVKRFALASERKVVPGGVDAE
jgi:biopolymer transport protein ExbD